MTLFVENNFQLKPLLAHLPTDYAAFDICYENSALGEDFFLQAGIILPEKLKTAILKRRIEFLAGRYCAQQALRDLGFDEAFDIKSSKNRDPQWPKDFIGSITHTKNYAAAIVGKRSHWSNIGIDAEVIVDESTPALQSHICNDGELDTLRSLDSEIDEALLFTLVFSAKESLYKALYPEVKTFFGFKSARVSGIDPRKKTFDIALESELSERYTKGVSFRGRFFQFENKVLTILMVSNTEVSTA